MQKSCCESSCDQTLASSRISYNSLLLWYCKAIGLSTSPYELSALKTVGFSSTKASVYEDIEDEKTVDRESKYLIKKATMLIEPVVIIGTKKFDSKFANFMSYIVDVVWNVFRMADFRRPPSIIANLIKINTSLS